MKSKKIKIGVVLASHVREPSSYSLTLVKKGIDRLKDDNNEVLFNDRPLIKDDEIREEIIRLKNNDVDVFVIIPGNWIEPPSLSHPLEEIRNEKILLWGFPESTKLISDGHFLGSASAYLVLKNSMLQMGFRFKAVQRFPDDQEAIREIKDYIKAAHVSKIIRRIKLGLIGYCSMGIYTTCFDQHKIRKVFGMEIDSSADSYILFKKMEDIREDLLEDIRKKIEASCEIDDSIIRDSSLEKSIKMYLALKDLISEGNWKGLTVKCQHELSTFMKCTACLPLSLLTDEGIMCTDESDIHALITMVIMKHLSDEEVPLYFGDIYILEEGGFLMSHCGLSPHSCAKEKTKIRLLPQTPRISKDGKTTGGVVSSYKFKEGNVTIGRIENDRGGNYFFHFCKGKVEPIKSLGYGMSTLRFIPEGDDRIFAENQLANHYVFIYDDIKDRISEFCNINGLKMII